jgi:thiol-disulfide isomerase/thioredoxin
MVALAPLAVAAVLIGDPLPVLELAEPGGAAVRLPEATRGKVAVIDLFATWCGPCRESLPALERLRRRFREVAFVSIGEDDDPALLAPFLRSLGVGAHVLHDPGRRAYAQLGAHRLPTTYLIDARGVVRKINHGSGPGYEARLRRWIEELASGSRYSPGRANAKPE